MVAPVDRGEAVSVCTHPDLDHRRRGRGEYLELAESGRRYRRLVRVIVDYGPDGQVVGFELLDAQQRGPWAAWVQWMDALQSKAART